MASRDWKGLSEAIPLCVRNRHRKNPSNTTKGDLLLHRATSFDPTVGALQDPVRYVYFSRTFHFH
jgi:hypothetical protein